MKRQMICFYTAVLLIIAVSISWAGPVAVPVDSKYEFPPMAEGQGLTHEFVVKNQGDTVLNILGVLPP